VGMTSGGERLGGEVGGDHISVTRDSGHVHILVGTGKIVYMKNAALNRKQLGRVKQ